MRAFSINVFGLISCPRTSGLGVAGLAAKLSVKSPRLDENSFMGVCETFADGRQV